MSSASTVLPAAIRKRWADTNHGGLTPLLHAIRSGQSECAQVLLELGADPDGAPGTEPAPMDEAMSLGNAEMVELLMDAGADFSQFLSREGMAKCPAEMRDWFEAKIESTEKKRDDICACARNGDVEGLIRLVSNPAET